MKKRVHRVLARRDLTESTFVLRFERGDTDFRPGQVLHLGLPGQSHRREYSIYSGSADPFLEVLIREVPGGHLSPRLRDLNPGDDLQVCGPVGHFAWDPPSADAPPATFVATGTGIAPFHCFVRSDPERKDYRLIHGVRHVAECYEREDYAAACYTACVSREAGGDFQGRVTTYLETDPPDPAGTFYLCGNADMVYEVFALLRRRGVTRRRIRAEVYF